MAKLETLQDTLWEFSWHKEGRSGPELLVAPEDIANDASTKPRTMKERYYHLDERADLRRAPRLYRTRKDPFEKVWDEVRLRLELRPELTAKAIVLWLMENTLANFRFLTYELCNAGSNNVDKT